MNSNRNHNLFEQIEETAEFIRSKGFTNTPEAALIFGSGLSNISSGMNVELEIPYGDIPNFARTTLAFHPGRLLFGTIKGRQVVAMDGRFHYYEGWSMGQIAFPIRVMKRLGTNKLLISNIAGGLNPEIRAGEIALIVDHINMMGDNPLIGKNDERLGPRFPDMIEPYSRRLIALMEKHARAMNIRLPRAVYLALQGPVFETRAEYRMLRSWGADLVGMSTVPEVIAAVHGGMEVLAVSLVSDECYPDCLEPLEVPVLLERARQGGEVIGQLIQAILADKEF